MTLWHYTCQHAARDLGRRGHLRPFWQPLLGLDATWATDLPAPDADALGLSRVLVSCDRTAHRYRVLEPEAFAWWPDWWPGNVDPFVVSLLGHPPVQPRHWWLALRPTPVVAAP